MAAVLSPDTATIAIALCIDLLACFLLIQGVVYGVRLIYSEDIRDRRR